MRVDGRWAPGLGDPSVMGWVTVVAYSATAILCGLAALQCTTAADGNRRARLLWSALALVMLALAVNKQLDLQSLLTQIGRDLALAQGWYEHRARVQLAFIVALGAGSLVALSVLAWLLRRQDVRLKLAWCGLVALALFVMARASSFHHMDRLIGFDIGGVRMNWVLELGGISLVATGATAFWRRSRA